MPAHCNRSRNGYGRQRILELRHQQSISFGPFAHISLCQGCHGHSGDRRPGLQTLYRHDDRHYEPGRRSGIQRGLYSFQDRWESKVSAGSICGGARYLPGRIFLGGCGGDRCHDHGEWHFSGFPAGRYSTAKCLFADGLHGPKRGRRHFRNRRKPQGC